jgi:hypothetical protein
MPDTAELPVTAAASPPTPVLGSDGPQLDLADPDRSRGAPADHRRAADPGRPMRLLHPSGPARAWWELLVVVAGGGAGAGLGYRVGRSRLGWKPHERAGCGT